MSNRKAICLWIVTFVMCIESVIVCASPLLIEVTGEYTTFEKLHETESIAEDRARTEAKRMAVERTAVYVKNFSRQNGYTLSRDETIVLAAGIVYVQNENVQREILKNGTINYRVTITADVDVDNLNLAEKLKDKEELQRQIQLYNQLNEQYNNQQRANEEFKQQYANAQASDDYTIEKISQTRKENEQNYQVYKLSRETLESIGKGDFAKSITIAEKILEYNPYSAMTYMNIGYCNFKLGNFEEAVKNLEIALSMQNNAEQNKITIDLLALSYIGTGLKVDMGVQSVAFLEKAEGYRNRIVLPSDKWEHDDILYGNLATHYSISAIEYHKQKKDGEAVKTFEKALKALEKSGIESKDSLSYIYFGLSMCHYRLKNKTLSLDFAKEALSINPNNKNISQWFKQLEKE